MTDTSDANINQSDEPTADREKGGLAGLRKITLIAISIAVVIFTYYVVADRTTPFAGDARVQAFVLRVAPEVTGQVESVQVTDNQIVEPGDILFKIDPTPFEAAVEQAEARLAQAGQNIGASTAAIDAAQAKVDEARAAEANVRVQSARVLDLVKRGVYAAARQDQAIAAIDEARAAVESAEADLQRAREELGSDGADNPQVRDAVAALERARFDLSRTSVSAPSRGVVTNLQLAGGQTVVAGQPALSFISGEDIWLLASMRENSLGVIESGQRAEVVLDIFPGQVFDATVTSIGWGIGGGKVDPVTGLPQTTSEAGWLVDPQRFPVNLVFDEMTRPRGARYGSRAAVIVYSADNSIMDAIAWARIRLIALLTYVS